MRDFTGAPSGHVVEWDVRTIYDFLFSLSEDAGGAEDLPAEDRRWLVDSRATLAADGHSLEQLRHDLSVHIASFAVERPWLQTVSSFLDALEAEGPGPLLEAAFGEALEGAPAARPIFDRAVRGDRSAVTELTEALPDWKRKDSLALLEDPIQTHRQVIALLRAWNRRFAEIDDRVHAILVRDYDARAEDRANLSPADVVEKATGGIRLLPEPGIRRVILAPSYFSRPYNFLLAGEDWRFFGYPVADSSLDKGDDLAPPLAVLRLHRALGDGTRLRILKLLAGSDLYLTEIAQQLELSKPTIKHHLSLLRAAGLLTVVESGSVMYYSLRRDRLEDATADLKSFLVG
jgi:DNA-binding transcriptional ArsR family regulator